MGIILIYMLLSFSVPLTKTIRDNINGQEIDADDAVEMTTIIRQNGKLLKVEFDVSHAYWLKFYQAMVKQPPYQMWIKVTDTEKQLDKNAKGHWEKIATPSK